MGDPTEGALVVLAAKGGVDPVLTRERYPRIAEVPFDAAYKFMATFHEMNDEDGKRRHPLLRQGCPGPAAGPRVVSAIGPDGSAAPIDQVSATRTWRRTSGSGRQGLRVMATGHARPRPGDVRPAPRPTCCRWSRT